MDFQEIIDRLKSEGIKFKDFVRYPSSNPEWVGPVQRLQETEGPRTKAEWRNHKVVLHLLNHGLYIEAHGVKDGGKAGARKWRYELSVVERKTEQVPAIAAYEKVTYKTAYPRQSSGYPDPTAGKIVAA